MHSFHFVMLTAFSSAPASFDSYFPFPRSGGTFRHRRANRIERRRSPKAALPRTNFAAPFGLAISCPT